jgi:hypothetical protein
LADKCLRLLKEAQIVDRAGFQRRYPVILNFEGIRQEIHFDFGTGVGVPNVLFNKVNLEEENSVTLAAGKCESAIRFGGCDKQRCFTFYEDETNDDDKAATIKFLGAFSTGINIADPGAASLLRRVA